jgi:hypothetical protein
LFTGRKCNTVNIKKKGFLWVNARSLNKNDSNSNDATKLRYLNITFFTSRLKTNNPWRPL